MGLSRISRHRGGEHRHPVPGEHRLHQILIGPVGPGYHPDVPEAEPLLAAPAPGCGPQSTPPLPGASGRQRAPLPPPAAALQAGTRGRTGPFPGSPEPPPVLRPPPPRCSTWQGTPRSRASPQQPGGRSAGGGEDAGPPLILLQMVTGEGDRHGMGLLQQAGAAPLCCWGVKSVKPSSHRSLPAAQGQSFSFSAVRVSRSLGSRATWAVRAS